MRVKCTLIILKYMFFEGTLLFFYYAFEAGRLEM